jgi:hypothetical protein
VASRSPDQAHQVPNLHVMPQKCRTSIAAYIPPSISVSLSSHARTHEPWADRSGARGHAFLHPLCLPSRETTVSAHTSLHPCRLDSDEPRPERPLTSGKSAEAGQEVPCRHPGEAPRGPGLATPWESAQAVLSPRPSGRSACPSALDRSGALFLPRFGGTAPHRAHDRRSHHARVHRRP